MDLCFVLQKLAIFSSNPGKVNFEGLVQFLRYIRYNKNLGLIYYAKIYNSPQYDLLRQSSINTDNQLMLFSDSIFQEFLDAVRSTGAYIVFYRGGKFYNHTYVPVTVLQSSA